MPEKKSHISPTWNTSLYLWSDFEDHKTLYLHKYDAAASDG